MATNLTLVKSLSDGALTVAKTSTLVVKTLTKLDAEEVPVLTSDKKFTTAVDISEVKALSIVASAACTVYVNDLSTGAPDATIVLSAGVPVLWDVGTGGTNPFGIADITSLYVTNVSDTKAVTISFLAGWDTP
jgi:hypothetical protein